MAGLPLVLALYYQDGLGYTALQSGLGVTAYALGSSVGAPLAGRVVTRIGRRLLLLGMVSFAAGAIALAALAGHGAAALAPALFVMGAGSGAIITPNQALTLMQVDPVAGSTAGGVLQTAQRIGIAVGQAVIGATFFVALHRGGYPHALRLGVVAALAFLLAATATTIADLVRRRRVST
jgi:MFS family permease